MTATSSKFVYIGFSVALAAISTGVAAQPAPASNNSSVNMPTGGVKTTSAGSSNSASQLAAKLTNPVADLISVPIQFNSYRGLGADGQGKAQDLVIQPVVPLSLNKDWNYIVRPVLTLGSQDNVDGFSGTGAGPVVIETFLSPNTNSKFIWGVGPIISTPALSGNEFGTRQTGAGVSAVGLYMSQPWTVGLLAYQTWNVGGSDIAGTANNSYWQPFVSYVTRDAWTFTLNTQSSFNWDSRRSQNPLNATISKLVHVGKVPMSLSVGGRYFLSSVPGGPSGWGVRAGVTLLFPK
jgi:hypothetical protein